MGVRLAEPASLHRIIPFALYMAFVVLEDLLGRLGWPPAQLRWLYPVKAAAVLAALVWLWRHYGELRRFDLGARGVFTAVAAGALVLALWLTLGAAWMTVGEPTGFDPGPGGAIDPLLVAVRLAGGALLVPVMEELFWRSFLLRWLHNPDFLRVDPAHVRLLAVVVTVLLFGVEHNRWLAGVAAGGVYCLLYMRSRSLWSAIVAHGVTNGLLGAWIIFTGQWSYW
jgi:hypothetical protein